MPFYGRTFGDVTPANNGRFQKFTSEGGFISWRDIVHTRLNNPDWEQHWDEEAQVPWLWNPKERRMVSYDDPRSLAIKVEYVKQQGLGGVMYWEQRQDDNEQLLDVLHKGLHSEQLK
ncbi:Chitinase A1 precursor [compost metagenome]